MSPLTQEIGELRDKGLSHKEIAAQLGTSEKAVKRHLEKYRTAQKATLDPKTEVKLDLVRERYEGELRHVKSKYHALMQRASLEERLIDAARDCIVAFPAPPPSQLVWQPTPDKDIEDVVLMFSDWHGGDVVSPAETLGLGGFNKSIAARRVEYCTEKFLSLVHMHRSTSTIKRAHIAVLGDMVSGTIHAELEKNADLTIMEQVYFCAYLLASAISDISREFEEVHVSCVPGNHGRLTIKPEAKKGWVSWDTMVCQMAAMMTANLKNVHWHIPESTFALMTVNGKRFLCFHGSQIRGWQGIPWYDAKRKSMMFNDMLIHVDEPVDGFLFGHFHSANILECLNGPMIINGSLVGPDEYSVVRLAAASRPTQYMFGVHERQGVSFRYPITLDQIPSPSTPLRYTAVGAGVWNKPVH